MAEGLLLGRQGGQLGFQGLALLQGAAQARLQLRLLRLQGGRALQRRISRALRYPHSVEGVVPETLIYSPYILIVYAGRAEKPMTQGYQQRSRWTFSTPQWLAQ